MKNDRILFKQSWQMRIRFYLPLFTAALLVFLWDWLKLEFLTWHQLFTSPIESIFGYLVLYFIAYCVSYGIWKLFSETKIISNSDYKTGIDEIIQESSHFLYIVTPYLEPGNTTIESIVEARSRGTQVILIHHSSQLEKLSIRNWLERLVNSGVAVYNHPHLHAKLYCNEKQFIVGSLNLVSSSYSNSFECGIKCDDIGLRSDVLDYIENKIMGSDLLSTTTLRDAFPAQGYCIRTKKAIEFNPKKPVEYNEFKQFGRSVDGKFCHACGIEMQSSVEHPLCTDCLKNDRLSGLINSVSSSNLSVPKS